MTDEHVLDQTEIERLLSGMDGRPTPQPEENRDSGILSTDELNALFGGEVNAIPMPDETNKKKPPSNEIMSKEEVENLLNMMSGTPPPPPQLAWMSNTAEITPKLKIPKQEEDYS